METKSKKSTYSLAEIAALIDAKLIGDGETLVTGIATLASAQPGQISFLANPRYRKQLPATSASAVIVQPDCEKECPCAALIHRNPYLAYARLSHYFDPAPVAETGVHASAVIHPSAKIGENVSVGPNAVIEDSVVLGDNVVVGPGTVIGANSRIGESSCLKANVTLYHNVSLGRRVTIHSGAVIGGDGFGFANDKGVWVKIAQVGGVQIGDDVDIGASTTIDRGALEDTVIGNGVIIDNQVQIAHNVKVGDCTAIAGCVGIAGSTSIGRNCTLAGAAGVAGHLTIVDNVHIGMQAQVTKSITKAGSYASGTGLMTADVWRRNAVRFRQLNDFYRRMMKSD